MAQLASGHNQRGGGWFVMPIASIVPQGDVEQVRISAPCLVHTLHWPAEHNLVWTAVMPFQFSNNIITAVSVLYHPYKINQRQKKPSNTNCLQYNEKKFFLKEEEEEVYIHLILKSICFPHNNINFSKIKKQYLCVFQPLHHHFFYCCAKRICLPPGSNPINVNDKERKSLKVSTSLGTLPNAQHCHFNDMTTAHKMTTQLLPARIWGHSVLLQSGEIAFSDYEMACLLSDG